MLAGATDAGATDAGATDAGGAEVGDTDAATAGGEADGGDADGLAASAGTAPPRSPIAAANVTAPAALPTGDAIPIPSLDTGGRRRSLG